MALPATAYSPTTGFEVVGPDGARLPVRLVTLDAGAPPRRARVVAVSESTGGWWVVVDAGASPPHHQGVRLPLAAVGLVELHVESSNDRREWTPLTDASLFRLGADAELRGSAVAYPPTDARYLRLEWPSAAKFPRLEAVELDTVAEGVEEVELPASACVAETGPRTVCDLGALGNRTVESVSVTLPGGRAAGWRMRFAENGAWRPLGEGSWGALTDPAERRAPAGKHDGPLRLELWGEGHSVTPVRVAAELLPLALELDVPAAGTYELRTGPGFRSGAASTARGEPAEWVVPGAPRDVPASFPAPSTEGATLPKSPFARHWPVRVRAAIGETVRLPLPAAVEAAARADLGDVRLVRQGHQVAYLVDATALPERAGSWDRLPLRPDGQGTSAAEISLPRWRWELGGELVLRVPARPLAREVRLVHQGESEGVGEVPAVTTPWTEWRCEPLPPLPCELTLLPPSEGRGPLRIEIADRDNAPLAELSAELWRPRRELLFPWPGEPVALFAGSPRLTAPQYDLAAVADDLRERPAQVARLGRAIEGSEGAPARWPRWAVLGSLGLAALVLLLLLARALPRMPQSEERREDG